MAWTSEPSIERPADVDAHRGDVLPASPEARWRLLLGAPLPVSTSGADARGPEALLAEALEGLYGESGAPPDGRARVRERIRQLAALEGVLPDEALRLAREDAMDPAALRQLLQEPSRLRPDDLADLEPTAPIISRLIRVADQLPATTLSALRAQVDALTRKLTTSMERPLRASLERRPGVRGTLRRRLGARLDLAQTLRHNLKHYDLRTQRLGIDRLFFRSHPAPARQRVIIALDSSGSMDDARLHGVMIAATLARIPNVDPRLLLFDTRVLDLTNRAEDPVGLLLNVGLGGGTDLGAAVAHATRLVDDPIHTLLVLISDFEPGGSRSRFLEGLQQLADQGVGLLCLRAPDPSKQGPDDTWVSALSAMGIPVHDCAPEDLAGPLASALARRRSSG